MKYLIYNLIPIKKRRQAILCLDCGWMRISFNRHDFRTCPCPNEAMVDGGEDYLRYGAKSLDKIQVLDCYPLDFKLPKSKKK